MLLARLGRGRKPAGWRGRLAGPADAGWAKAGWCGGNVGQAEPRQSGLAGQAGPRPEERSGELGRGLLGQKEEGARLVMLGPDLAFLFPIFIFPN